jgi:hypothetical protein
MTTETTNRLMALADAYAAQRQRTNIYNVHTTDARQALKAEIEQVLKETFEAGEEFERKWSNRASELVRIADEQEQALSARVSDSLRDLAERYIKEDEASEASINRLMSIGRKMADAMLSAPQPEARVPDGLPLVIAGAIFDFAGFLTTREKVIRVGSTANASPIADLVKEWASKRGLSLDDAAVLSWQEWLAPQPASECPHGVDDGACKECYEDAKDAARYRWQPIETAPVGVEVLAAVEFDGPGDWRIKPAMRMESGRWNVNCATWTPTHWMPLPTAPDAAMKEGGAA